MCKRSVDEPMMGIPDRPESWPASRFFAVLGPAANVAQGSGTVVGRGVVSATPTATDHAHATLFGATSNSPAVSPSSSHQPAELSAQPASQRVYDSTASHQRDDPRVERCAYHAISKRHIMPKASDTTPSEETTHIIHHHGLHRPSTRLDKTESDETERLVKREERPDQDKLEGTPSQLASKRVKPVMADAHHSIEPVLLRHHRAQEGRELQVQWRRRLRRPQTRRTRGRWPTLANSTSSRASKRGRSSSGAAPPKATPSTSRGKTRPTTRRTPACTTRGRRRTPPA